MQPLEHVHWGMVQYADVRARALGMEPNAAVRARALHGHVPCAAVRAPTLVHGTVCSRNFKEYTRSCKIINTFILNFCVM